MGKFKECTKARRRSSLSFKEVCEQSTAIFYLARKKSAKYQRDVKRRAETVQKTAMQTTRNPLRHSLSSIEKPGRPITGQGSPQKFAKRNTKVNLQALFEAEAEASEEDLGFVLSPGNSKTAEKDDSSTEESLVGAKTSTQKVLQEPTNAVIAHRNESNVAPENTSNTHGFSTSRPSDHKQDDELGKGKQLVYNLPNQPRKLPPKKRVICHQNEGVVFNSSKRLRKSFGGVRRRNAHKNDTHVPEVVQFQIPSCQYWAVVEGISAIGNNDDNGAFLERLLAERNPSLLPDHGRVLEMLSLESMAGTWTAQMQQKHPLGLLRDRPEDWKDRRIILRHENHGAVSVCTHGHSAPEGYTTAIVNPSLQREIDMDDQGIVLKSRAFASTLSIIAFDGFLSSSENRETSPTLASQVLDTCRDHPCWSEKKSRLPDMVPIPSLNVHNDNNPLAAALQLSGGISVVGCFVDDLTSSKPNMDYTVVLLRHEQTSSVVGIDVIFQSQQRSDADLSPSSASPIPTTQTISTLTSKNLASYESSWKNTSAKTNSLVSLPWHAQPNESVSSVDDDIPVALDDEHDDCPLDVSFDRGPKEDNFPKEKVAALPSTSEENGSSSLWKATGKTTSEAPGELPVKDVSDALIMSQERNESRTSAAPRTTTKVAFKTTVTTLGSDSDVHHDQLLLSTRTKSSVPATIRHAVCDSTVHTPHDTVTVSARRVTPASVQTPENLVPDNKAKPVDETPMSSRLLLFHSRPEEAATGALVVDQRTMVQYDESLLFRLSEHLPSIHDVFFGVHDDLEYRYLEASHEELLSYQPKDERKKNGGFVSALFHFCNDLLDGFKNECDEDEDDNEVLTVDLHDLFYGQEEMAAEEILVEYLEDMDVLLSKPPVGFWASLVAFSNDLFADEDVVILSGGDCLQSWAWEFFFSFVSLAVCLPFFYWLLQEFISWEASLNRNLEQSEDWYRTASNWYEWATQMTAPVVVFGSSASAI